MKKQKATSNDSTNLKLTIMQKKTQPLAIFSTILLISLLVIGACSQQDEGSIPITTTSDKARDYYLDGRDMLEKLRRVEAHEYFAKALIEDSLFAMAHLSIANTQPSARGFFESLAKAKALIKDVSEGERLLILTAEAGVNGDQETQAVHLKKLIELYPLDARAHNRLGEMYFGQQNYDSAIAVYNKAILIDPSYSPPYNQLGYCYRFIGQLDKAAEIFQKYTALIPNDPNPHDSYAELLLKKGEFDLSIESYRRALAIDPGFIESYIGVASNLCYQGKHDEARVELRQLYAVAHNDGQRRRALFGIATTFINEGQIDSAKAAILRARRIAEQIQDIRAIARDYNTLGALELERGKFKLARTLYDSAAILVFNSDLDAVSKNNTLRFHYFNIARVAMQTNNLHEADSLSEEFTKNVAAISNIGLTALTHQLRGMIALERKEFETALAELNQSNPRNPYNHYRLALTLQGQEEFTKATDELKFVVGFNSVLDINFALVRGKAQRLLDSLSQP